MWSEATMPIVVMFASPIPAIEWDENEQSPITVLGLNLSGGTAITVDADGNLDTAMPTDRISFVGAVPLHETTADIMEKRRLEE